MASITFQEFLVGHKNGEFTIAVNKNKAGDLVLSSYANKHNRIAHLFWSWAGLIIFLPLSLILLFWNWEYSIISFIAGMIIMQSARKSAATFVAENMLQNEDFFEYTLLHGGARILDKGGNELKSAFLERMSTKNI